MNVQATTDGSAIADRYNLEAPDDSKANELGQDEFLQLMLTQIEHQDPFKPMENGEFIGQMAQFSTVTGIEKMQTSLEELATTFGSQQTLGASELVGRDVLAPGDELRVDEGSMAGGRFELDDSAQAVSLMVYDPAGALVAQRALGAHPAGRHDFEWDGFGDEGNALPAGEYRFSVVALSGDDELPVNTFVTHRVDSVEFGAGGAVILNTIDGETLNLGDVRAIQSGTAADTDEASDADPDATTSD